MVVSLHMGWRHVLFANWPVDPDVVQPHVPDALHVDTYDGQAWLSVVPYTNVDVRPTWLPDGLGVALPELNLRTYVTRDGTEGVYFFSLDAAGILGVLGARLFHHLPYYYARIDLAVEKHAVEQRARSSRAQIRFESERRHPGARPAHFRASYGPTGERFTPDADSLASFLVDRSRYFTEAPSGRLRYAAVEHGPWPLYEAAADIGTNTLFRANEFADPGTDPTYLYSPGLDTVASPSRRLQ